MLPDQPTSNGDDFAGGHPLQPQLVNMGLQLVLLGEFQILCTLYLSEDETNFQWPDPGFSLS